MSAKGSMVMQGEVRNPGQAFGHSLSIDEILARVRKETPATQAEAEVAANRRRGLGTIPMISEPDDGEKLPLGRPFYTIEEFAALDDEDFLRNAYRIVLGREMDGVGRSYYLPALRQGHIGVVRVLSALRRSGEGRVRGVKIRWLMPAAILDRLGGLPVVGKFFDPLMRFIVRSTTSQRLAIVSERHQRLIGEVNAALSAIRMHEAAFDMRMGMAEQEALDMRRDAGRIYDEAQLLNDTSLKALSEIRAIRHEIAGGRAALGQWIDRAKAALPLDGPAGASETASDLATGASEIKTIEDQSLDSLYVAFENRFRGSTAEISRRSERYLPIFEQSEPVRQGGVVLDIGCGRGEFLQLLKRNKITPRGIDLNGAMVAEASAHGLDVLEGDAIAYLAGLGDNSLAAMTGFHIVEHIGFRDLVRLFDEAMRVLQPGGFVLFETPNPENLVVGACTFHYDPTHNKPLPPDYLAFVAGARGFGTTRIIRTDGDCDLSQTESGFDPQEINDWFRQPADYALYAEKTDRDGQN